MDRILRLFERGILYTAQLLLETLRVYFAHHRVRLEIILVVAIIAVGRHNINMDVEHMSGASLAGIAALVSGLAGGYYVIRLAGPGEKS